MNTLGTNLKKIRKINNLTQKQLAEISGLTSDYISKLEVNRRENPSIEVIKKIADALNCTVEDLTSEKTKNLKEEVFPEKFENPKDARTFVRRNQVFKASDFDASKFTDEEIIKFANDVLEMMKLMTYKYKK